MQKASLPCGIFLTLFGWAKISNKKPIFVLLSMQSTVKYNKNLIMTYILFESGKIGSSIYLLPGNFGLSR